MRDLLKLCKRLSHKLISNETILSAKNLLDEISDVFLASINDFELQEFLFNKIQAKLNSLGLKIDSLPEIKLEDHHITSIGRMSNIYLNTTKNKNFAYTTEAVKLLEQLAVANSLSEPCLLIGETGVGKTTSLQYLANGLESQDKKNYHENNLIVFNMSQSANISDLIGSYKPIELSRLVKSCIDLFLLILNKTGKLQANNTFVGHLSRLFTHKNYDQLVELLGQASMKMLTNISPDSNQFLHQKLTKLQEKLVNLKLKISESRVKQNVSESGDQPASSDTSAMLFDWVDGTLIEAIKAGNWVLFDEINLAPLELLERISPLLEPYPSSITLAEKGDLEPIKRHPNFRIFAAMNPATDVGKKTLSDSVRSRFTEFYVDEPKNETDLVLIFEKYLSADVDKKVINLTISLYKKIKFDLAKNCLLDGNNKRPIYSLRTFCRVLSYAASLKSINVIRALHEGYLLAFLSGLDSKSQNLLREFIDSEFSKLFQDDMSDVNGLKQSLGQTLPIIGNAPFGTVTLDKKILSIGEYESEDDPKFIRTPHIMKNISSVVRALHAKRYPILLQGETSTGKTSLIKYLAKLRFGVRVGIAFWRAKRGLVAHS